jgi:hypothetical protein
MNRQGFIPLFSLLSFSQKTEGFLACTFAGRGGRYEYQLAMFRIGILPEEERQQKVKF